MYKKGIEPFLLWLLMFSVICFGMIMFLNLGGLQKVYEVDFTRISFLIFAIFSYFTIRVGMFTYKLCKYPDDSFKKSITKKSEVAWFFANKLTSLGMIGTVAGFIRMLSTDISIDPSAINTIMTSMLGGAGAALYTTATGLICGLLLQLQLFNLDYNIKKSVSGEKENEKI